MLNSYNMNAFELCTASGNANYMYIFKHTLVHKLSHNNNDRYCVDGHETYES